MNLLELQKHVNRIVEAAVEDGNKLSEVAVYLQIEGPEDQVVYTDNVELHYDNYTQAPGCVVVGYL